MTGSTTTIEQGMSVAAERLGRRRRARADSPRDGTEVTRYRARRLAHVGDQLDGRIAALQEPLDGPGDADRADEHAPAVLDRRGVGDLTCDELFDIRGPPAGAGRLELRAQLARVGD